MENTRLHKSSKQSLKLFSQVSIDGQLDHVQIIESAKEADLIVKSLDDEHFSLTFVEDANDLKILKSNLIPHIQRIARSYSREKLDFKKILKKNTISQSQIFSNFLELLKIKNVLRFIQESLSKNLLTDVPHVHFVFHKKGDISASYAEISSNNLDLKRMSVEEFNDVFNTIKKAKQTTFAESFLKSSQINIVGTCLAKAASFRSHNLIIIGTRSEFIPYGKNHIFDFNLFCNINLNLFDVILENQDQLELTSKLQSISDTLKDYDLTEKKINNEFHIKRISLLGELLNTLRHELSNPLFGIQLSASIATEELKQPDDRELAEQILEAIEKCLNILNGFSKLYSSSDQIQSINLLKLIDEVFTLTKSETKMIKREIECEPSLLNSKGELIIQNNPTSLSQIFFNLIINSSQAMRQLPSGQAKIGIKISQELTGLRVDYMDSGPGISVDTVETIFDPFYTTKQEGTGLGLSICRNLAQKQGGDLWCVKSDKGAQFVLILAHASTVS